MTSSCLAVLCLFILPVFLTEPDAQQIKNQPFTHFLFIQKIGKESTSLYASTHVLPSITIAQAILESNWGTSTLSTKANNYFGIKTQSLDKKKFVLMETNEVVQEKTITIKAKFARFSSVKASIQAHATLLKEGTSDKPDRYLSVLTATNYQQAAKALYKDGYATDPAYANSLITLIKQYKLDSYDQAK